MHYYPTHFFILTLTCTCTCDLTCMHAYVYVCTGHYLACIIRSYCEYMYRSSCMMHARMWMYVQVILHACTCICVCMYRSSCMHACSYMDIMYCTGRLTCMHVLMWMSSVQVVDDCVLTMHDVCTCMHDVCMFLHA